MAAGACAIERQQQVVSLIFSPETGSMPLQVHAAFCFAYLPLLHLLTKVNSSGCLTAALDPHHRRPSTD